MGWYTSDVSVFHVPDHNLYPLTRKICHGKTGGLVHLRHRGHSLSHSMGRCRCGKSRSL